MIELEQKGNVHVLRMVIDDNRFNARGDHLVDECDLLGEIGFVPDAVYDQLVGIGVLRMMRSHRRPS